MFANPADETREDIRDRLNRTIAKVLFEEGFIEVPSRITAAIEQASVDLVRLGLRARVRRDSDNEITAPFDYEQRNLPKTQR